jgi:hypothetical protein
VIAVGVFVWRRRAAAKAAANGQVAQMAQTLPVLAGEKVIIPQAQGAAPAALFEVADAAKSSGRTGAQE